ncbi:MAG: hypothetical protein KDK34_11600 [Leptospiraceae bacterium]|nr:hypothetical protein [Leptospiraceae bacterium]MCB1320892.1 hypothetical protein [Leptospiraceae bacterium]
MIKTDSHSSSATVADVEIPLADIVRSPVLHARWLRTLSMLEFMGTRKIARSMRPDALNEMRLAHLSEEARHAHFFQRMANRVASDFGMEDPDAFHVESTQLSSRDLLAGFAAARYFHALDAGVFKALRQASLSPERVRLLCYLYVTALIEERAGVVYSKYEEQLRLNAAPFHLRGILAEEDRHLSEMYARITELDAGRQRRLYAFRMMEQYLFARFATAIQKTVVQLSARSNL